MKPQKKHAASKADPASFKLKTCQKVEKGKPREKDAGKGKKTALGAVAAVGIGAERTGDADTEQSSDNSKSVVNAHLFLPEDLINPPLLAERILEHENPVSRFLRDQISTERWQVLIDPNRTPKVNFPAVLAEELNKVVTGAYIYSAERFDGVKLSIATQFLIGKSRSETVNPSQELLNRLLIEDSYPGMFRGWWMTYPNKSLWGYIPTNELGRPVYEPEDESFRETDAILEKCLPADGLQEKLRATSEVMIHLDKWNASPGGSDEWGPAVDPATGFTTLNYHALRRAARDAGTKFSVLLPRAMDALLEVIRQGNGDQAARAVSIMLDTITGALRQIKSMTRDTEKQTLFVTEARLRMEFPSLLSIFQFENSKANELVLDTLKLGHDLPFKIDPRKPYTPFNFLAMNIVLWIDRDRKLENSIYRELVPDLGDFRKHNEQAWKTAIAFHMDYFMSHGQRWKKVIPRIISRLPSDPEVTFEIPDDPEIKDGLAPDERFRENQKQRLSFYGAPFGDLTQRPEFSRALDEKKDTNVKTPEELYNRVKHKVITAALSLFR